MKSFDGIIRTFKKVFVAAFSQNIKFRKISCDDDSKISVSENVEIRNSEIKLNNSTLIIGEGTIIEGYIITLHNANFTIGKNSILNADGAYHTPHISISTGELALANNTKIKCNISIAFGGKLTVGEYTAINENTTIRCDEAINIGSFCMISYECLILDTNTHNILPPEIRRSITVKDFPYIGNEYTKPVTKPVKIGDDCWVGQRSVILKGVNMGNESIIGLGSVVTKNVPEKKMACGNPAKII